MPETPPFSPTIALLAVSRVWEEKVAAALKPLGLTTRKYGLLGHIRRTPGISFSELARRSRITVQSVHVAVAAFTAAGLVQDSSARAGAASHLEVTEEGARLLADAASRVAELDASLVASHPGLAEALRLNLPGAMSVDR
jgi:DNA-binding MarR family transcriptional regulator